MGREALGKALLVILGLAAAIGAVEVVAGRAPGLILPGAVRSPDELERIERQERRRFREQHDRRSVYRTIEDSRISRIGVPGALYHKYGLDHTTVVAYNALGIRGRDPVRLAGQRTALLLGDSFVEAREHEVPDTAARVLERRLEAGGDRWWIVNAGIGATGTANQLHLLERLVPIYRPSQVVLLFFLGNDLINNSLPFQTLLEAFDQVLAERLAFRAERDPAPITEGVTQRPFYRSVEGGPVRFVPSGKLLTDVLSAEELARFERSVATRREQVGQCLRSLEVWRRVEAVASRLAPDAVSLLAHRLGLSPARRCARTLEGTPPQLWLESARIRREYPQWWDEAWAISDFLLGSIRNLTVKARVGFAVAILPPVAAVNPELRRRLLDGYGLEDIERVEEPPAQTLMRRLAAMEVPAIDLSDALRRHPRPRDLYLPIDPHFSAEGQAWLAEQLRPLLEVSN